MIEAHRRDPEAPLFQEEALGRLLAESRVEQRPDLRAQVARFAVNIHPDSLILRNSAAAAFEAAGDLAAARESNTRCLSLPAPDWRSQLAQSHCRERSPRLR